MMIRRLGPYCLIALAALSGGCVLFPAHQDEPAAPVVSLPPIDQGPRDQDLGTLLSYYRELQGMPEKGLERERQTHQAAAVPGRCDPERLRFALALLRTLEMGIRQEVPEDVLKACLSDPTLANTSVQHFALLLQTQLREVAAAQARQRGTQHELDLMRKENTELKRQLDGLRAIERSLQDRRRRQSEVPDGSTR